MRQVLGVAWYRFRATLGSRWRGYLSVVLLIGLLGGVAMASVAAGRRTQSSYPTFLASTNPSDLTVSIGSNSPDAGSFDAAVTTAIARLPDLRRVDSLVSPAVVPLAADGAPSLAGLQSSFLQFVGSPGGMFFNEDRATVVAGRMADPARADQAVMTESAAQQARLHIGQVLPLGYYTAAQIASPGFGTPRVRPRLRVNVRLVGIVVLNRQVVQDDVDRASGFVIFTPALIRAATAASPGGHLTLAPGAPVLYGMQLDHGGRDVAAVERAFARVAPADSNYTFNAASRVVTEVEIAVKPESVAVGVFGAIAGLVALVIGILAISRQFRWESEDRQVLRALGAGPAAAVGGDLAGVLVAVVLGSLLAVAVAAGLSPLAPLGPVRPVYPSPGIAFDWTVLGTGLVVLACGLGAAAVALAYLGAPHRAARSARPATRGSGLARLAESAGLPVTGVVGVRFALEPGRGRTAVPVRSALLGAVLAVAVVVAALTFASGLSTLVSHPALYGWNWNYMLDTPNDVPPVARAMLGHDPEVAGWAGADIYPMDIDGQYVPSLVADPPSRVAPPILSGHGLTARNQIVLGSTTLALLRKHVGDTVYASLGTPKDFPGYIPPTRLAIVGTATFPAIGYSSLIADHPSMGTGALFSAAIEPPALVRAATSPDPNLNGPQYVFVRLRAGVSAAAGLASLQHIADAANKVIAADPNAVGNTHVFVLGVQRPAQIVNYRTIGATPIVLAAGLAAGAIAALGLTLTAAVVRRRRDLALLKALGFTGRQLRAAVSWQSTVAAVTGIAIGAPLGIILGRQLWILFARNVNAVPDATVPALSVFLVALGALVFANLAAAFPGHTASRSPTALVLRAE
jgi:FtsX-like permease family